MPSIHLPPPWRLPESAATPRDAWLSRRGLIKRLGLAAGALGAGAGCEAGPLAELLDPRGPIPEAYAYSLPPFARASTYDGPHAAAITPEIAAASYNNYYEFTTDKARVWRRARDFQPTPWAVEVSGQCAKPRTFDLDDLLREMPIEERVYRFRCVEAWSMVVPWVGFPLRALLAKVEPTRAARFVRLVTLDDRDRYPGVADASWYPWPYHEGLTIAEATHDLTMLAVGVYGHPLPNQHGAPVRLVVPWKYGYKNIKAIVKIELTRRQPKTFWSGLAGDEYDFDGGVRPDIPHPRWSQASERILPTGERVPTRMFNGYAEWVSGLYEG